MTVEIGPFFKMPNKFFGSGTAQKLGPSGSLLFTALHEHANREGANTFKASDKALASETTLSTRTICDARKKLVENNLIACSRENGQSFTYTLSPLTLEWLPLADRPRLKRRPRAIHAARMATAQDTKGP
ncbi:MAG: hypothetical protein WCD70_02910 [Alphaproteobacteria bacterium]